MGHVCLELAPKNIKSPDYEKTKITFLRKYILFEKWAIQILEQTCWATGSKVKTKNLL